MRILVISDVHGNLPALESVLKDEKNVDLVISLGDVVNYGPWSNECVELLETLESKILIMGNHEQAFIKGQYEGSHPVAKEFFRFCYPDFNKLNIISKYHTKYSFSNFNLIHTLNDSYIFSDTELELNHDTFIGHSHRMFSRIVNGFRLVNVGSVGQNRVNIDELNYVVWQPEKNDIKLISKEFSSDALVNEMKYRGYSSACVSYILSKRNKS